MVVPMVQGLLVLHVLHVLQDLLVLLALQDHLVLQALLVRLGRVLGHLVLRGRALDLLEHLVLRGRVLDLLVLLGLQVHVDPIDHQVLGRRP